MCFRPQLHRNLPQWQQETDSPNTLGSDARASQRGWRSGTPPHPPPPHTQGRGWASG